MNIEKYDLTYFKKGLKALKMELSERQLEQFLTFYELLTEWNSFMNLTAITEFQEVVQKHFLDSLALVRVCSLRQQTLIDVGTGAGFPGIPLKIAFPELKVTLLDSLNKRISFLNTVIDTLNMKQVETIHGRAEDFAKNPVYREKYDLCVSRAVSNLTTLSEYCLPFVKVGGSFVSYKSEKLTEELREAGKAIAIFGGEVENQVEWILPDSDIYRNLLVIRKNKNTPGKYPRKAGIPAKEPLK